MNMKTNMIIPKIATGNANTKARIPLANETKPISINNKTIIPTISAMISNRIIIKITTNMKDKKLIINDTKRYVIAFLSSSSEFRFQFS